MIGGCVVPCAEEGGGGEGGYIIMIVRMVKGRKGGRMAKLPDLIITKMRYTSFVHAYTHLSNEI